MKTSYKIMFATMLATGLVGCGKEEAKKEAPKAAAVDAPMVVKIARWFSNSFEAFARKFF